MITAIGLYAILLTAALIGVAALLASRHDDDGIGSGSPGRPARFVATDAGVLVRRARANFNAGDRDTARYLCDRALAVDPSHRGALQLLAVL